MVVIYAVLVQKGEFIITGCTRQSCVCLMALVLNLVYVLINIYDKLCYKNNSLKLQRL